MRGYIRTRRGPAGTTYQLAVYVGLDENGRRRYRYETVRGSRREAERRLAGFVSAADSGEVGSNRTARFGELVDAWWEVSTGDLSPNTRIGYRGILDRYLLPALRQRRLDRIGPANSGFTGDEMEGHRLADCPFINCCVHPVARSNARQAPPLLPRRSPSMPSPSLPYRQKLDLRQQLFQPRLHP